VSLENEIMGFLSMKPLSGYDIKKLFNMSASYFWPADQTQIYRTLKKLTADGFVELKEQTHVITVDKKVYEITGKGRESLLTWISNPSASDYISRLPQVMQLFFSGVLSPEEQLDFLDKQLKLDYELLQKLEQNYEQNGDAFAEIVELPEGDLYW